MISYMVSLGMSISVNIRVGQHLGARQVEQAKHTYRVALTIVLIITTVLCILFLTCQYYIAGLFTSDLEVQQATADLLSVYAPFTYLDGFSATASGVLKGSGRQLVGAIVNIIFYYAIAIPIGIPLSLLTWLEIRGFWIGLLIGLSGETLVFWLIILRTNWAKEVSDAQDRVAGSEAGDSRPASRALSAAASLEEDVDEVDYTTAEQASLLPRRPRVRSASRIYDTPYEVNVEFDALKPPRQLPPLRSVLLKRLLMLLCMLALLLGAILLRLFQDEYLPEPWRKLCLLQPLNSSIGTNLTYCDGVVPP